MGIKEGEDNGLRVGAELAFFGSCAKAWMLSPNIKDTCVMLLDFECV